MRIFEASVTQKTPFWDIKLSIALGDVCELIGDGLLPSLVVFERQFVDELLGIVGCGLHRYHPCRILCRYAVKKGPVKPYPYFGRNHDFQKGV